MRNRRRIQLFGRQQGLRRYLERGRLCRVYRRSQSKNSGNQEIHFRHQGRNRGQGLMGLPPSIRTRRPAEIGPCIVPLGTIRSRVPFYPQHDPGKSVRSMRERRRLRKFSVRPNPLRMAARIPDCVCASRGAGTVNAVSRGMTMPADGRRRLAAPDDGTTAGFKRGARFNDGIFRHRRYFAFHCHPTSCRWSC